MLLLNANTKAYKYGKYNSTIAFDLGDFERSKSKLLKFWRLMSRKGAQLGHMFTIKHQ